MVNFYEGRAKSKLANIGFLKLKSEIVGERGQESYDKPITEHGPE